MARSSWPALASPLAVLPVMAFVWLGAAAIAQAPGKNGAQPPRRAAVALEEAFSFIQRVPPPPDTAVLAAQGTPEGHWRFVNKSGEMFTVGTPDEMKRVVTVLYPDATTGTRLALYMTEDTLLGKGVRFSVLPSGAERHIVVGQRAYRLLPPEEAPRYAQIRLNVGVDVRGNPLLKESLRRLAEPLSKAGVRLLALDPRGPGKLPQEAPDAGKAIQGEPINPADLEAALAGLTGSTVVVCARGEGDLVFTRPAGGLERSLPVSELLAGAEGAEVTLLVLQFTSLRPSVAGSACPDGGRSPAELTLADILDAAAVQSRQAPVAVALAGRLKALDAVVVGNLAGGTEIRLGDARLRHQGWGLRVGLPLPALYIGLLLLGWLGTPVARNWWAKLWRAGDASDYAGHAGHWAARMVSFLVFAFVFQPLTAVLTAPANLAPQIWGAVRSVARAVRWVARLGGGGKVKAVAR